MKPAFALSLSFDGISLLHRSPGGWRLVGELALDTADLTAGLADLRAKAQQLAPGELQTKLLIPNEQIKYLNVETGTDLSPQERDDQVRRALSGATPYAVSDLVYDISIEGSRTYVATVARDTLGEAESFAVLHKFNPVSFVGVPDRKPFRGEPYFGQTEYARGYLPEGENVEPDRDAMVVVGPALLTDGPELVPEPPKPALHVGVTDGGLPPETDDAPATQQAPAAGFSSRRRRQTPVGSDGLPAFESRRHRSQTQAPPPASAPVVVPDNSEAPPAPVTVAAELRAEPPLTTSPARPTDGLLRRQNAAPDPAEMPARLAVAAAAQPDLDESQRMTVFGARAAAPSGGMGRPRVLGLVTTAVMLVFLAGVAAWASIFLDDGLSRFFTRAEPDATPEITEPAEAQDTAQTTPEPDQSVLDAIASVAPKSVEFEVPTLAEPDIDAGDALNRPIDPEEPIRLTSVDPGNTGLTDTDAAVLDALRSPRAPDAAQPVTQAPPQEAEALYAATGIWQQAPEEPEPPALISIDDVFIGAIDNRELSQDAVALQAFASLQTDEPLGKLASPASPDTRFTLDPRGLVTPTPEGTVNPDGVVVYLGRPSIVPPPVPDRSEPVPEVDEARERLAASRPRARPTDLAERAERTLLGGLTREELAGVRPRPRPESAQRAAEAAQAAESEAAEEVAEATEETGTEAQDEPAQDAFATATARAVAQSSRPNTRPQGFAARADRQRKDPQNKPEEKVASVAPATVTPRIPSSASVAKQATLNNAINLRQVNLIGVYGTPSDRRALVRLPSGRYKKVRVGDTIDGGRVSAIGDSELRYQKGGRNLVLKIPSG